jgi:hypothetical protein
VALPQTAPPAIDRIAALETSRPVVIDGRFIGVALGHAGGWTFRAIDPAFAALHGRRFPGPAAMAAAAHRLRGRASPSPTPVMPESAHAR